MSPTVAASSPPISEASAQAMTAYGIERVPVDYFHWHGFRYSTLKDAIAAARRAQRDASDAPHA